MTRTPRAATAAALAFLVAGCGDGAPAEPASTPPAEALADVVLGLVLDAGVGGGTAAASTGPRPAAGAASLDLGLEFDAPCPLGGSVDVELGLIGSADPETGAATLALALNQAPRGCQVRHAPSGRRFTLDAAPGITAGLDVERAADGSVAFEGFYTGGVAWASGDDADTCTFDLAFSGSGDPGGARSGTLAGTACGVAIDHAWSR